MSVKSIIYNHFKVIVNNPGADELVVFDNDAIRPAYLLMYDA